MVKAKQLPTKIRTQQHQQQQQQKQQQKQQENYQQHTKSQAKSKSKPKSIMGFIERPNVINVIRENPSFTKSPITLKKRKSNKQKEPVRRSPLMANALLPLMPSKPKDKYSSKFQAGQQQKIESKTIDRNRGTVNGAQTLLIIPNSMERLERPKKPVKSILRRNLETLTVRKAEKNVTHQPVSVNTFYEKGQRVRSQRYTPMPFKHSTRPHLGATVAREEGGQSNVPSSTAGAKHNQNSRANQKNNDMEVPLTNRLPIIDFISTDDFARMHATKKQKAARRLALAKEANE